jgi:hypothetical protein
MTTITRFNRCSPRLLRLALLSSLFLCVSCDSNNRWSGEDWSGKSVRLEITSPSGETNTHFINPDDPSEEISETVTELLSRDFDKTTMRRARVGDELLSCKLSFPTFESGPEEITIGKAVGQIGSRNSMADIHFRIVRRSDDRLGFGIDRRATADEEWKDTETRDVDGLWAMIYTIEQRIERFKVFAKTCEAEWDE